MSDDPTLTLAAAATAYAAAHSAATKAWDRYQATGRDADFEAWEMACHEDNRARVRLLRAALVANGVEP